MPDLKPPRTDADERTTLLALLQYQRESFVRKVEDVDEDAARREVVPTTSLLWLTKHLARAEQTWVVERFTGRASSLPDDTVAPGDTMASAIDAYRATWRAVDRIVGERATLDDRCAAIDAEPNVNLRWVLMHLLEETARHAGHADIIRELIDGRTGR